MKFAKFLGFVALVSLVSVGSIATYNYVSQGVFFPTNNSEQQNNNNNGTGETTPKPDTKPDNTPDKPVLPEKPIITFEHDFTKFSPYKSDAKDTFESLIRYNLLCYQFVSENNETIYVATKSLVFSDGFDKNGIDKSQCIEVLHKDGKKAKYYLSNRENYNETYYTQYYFKTKKMSRFVKEGLILKQEFFCDFSDVVNDFTERSKDKFFVMHKFENRKLNTLVEGPDQQKFTHRYEQQNNIILEQDVDISKGIPDGKYVYSTTTIDTLFEWRTAEGETLYIKIPEIIDNNNKSVDLIINKKRYKFVKRVDYLEKNIIEVKGNTFQSYCLFYLTNGESYKLGEDSYELRRLFENDILQYVLEDGKLVKTIYKGIGNVDLKEMYIGDPNESPDILLTYIFK